MVHTLLQMAYTYITKKILLAYIRKMHLSFEINCIELAHCQWDS